jgi:hypothetical protein
VGPRPFLGEVGVQVRLVVCEVGVQVRLV